MERERERCRHCRERCRERCREHGAEKSRPEQTDTQSRPGQPSRHTDQTRPEQTRPDTQRESQRQLELNCAASRPFLGLHSLLGLSQLIDVLDILCTVSSSTTITSITSHSPPVEIWKEARKRWCSTADASLPQSPLPVGPSTRKTNQPVERGAREYPCPR
jgi:hypothetical protein